MKHEFQAEELNKLQIPLTVNAGKIIGTLQVADVMFHYW